MLARPALEPLALTAAILVYIWLVAPAGSDKLRIASLAVVLAIPIVSNVRHGDRLRDLGFRLDNLRRSALQVGLATAVLAGLIVAIAGVGGHGVGPRAPSRATLLVYPAWAFLQQYALQAFAYRRLREALGRPGRAALVAALIFGVLHLPNVVLVGCTLLAAYVWCRLYERTPNLLTLALAHGLLAALLNASWPASWLHNLRVGPGYWASP